MTFDTGEFYALLNRKRLALSQAESYELELEPLRQKLSRDCREFNEAVRKEDPELARTCMEAYVRFRAALGVMTEGGRYPENQTGKRYSETLVEVDTFEAQHVRELCLAMEELFAEWERKHPAPQFFWWGAGNPYGWPLLFGPRESV